MPEVTFQSLTRRREIGAHCFILESAAGRIALDSGMHPRERGTDALPDFALLEDGSLDAVIVSHAHLDHTGSLPVLMRRHPRAQVFLTPVTAAIASAMLHNSVNVMTFQREQDGVTCYPLFTHREVDVAARKWLTVPPGRVFEPGESGMFAELYDAGHLPGSAGIRIDIDGLRIFYTGDVQFEDQTLMKGAQFPSGEVDVLIMECTRGAYSRPAEFSREQEARRLAGAISRTVKSGGSVLIPVFALGKTQEVLLMIHELRRSGLIPLRTTVHIGGLGTRMTEIIDQFASDIPRRHRGFRILDSMDGLVKPRRGERPTSSLPGRVYALSSGMMTENTVSNDFAFHFIGNPKNAVYFAGYADPESPAYALLSSRPGEAVKLHPSYDPVVRRCEVDRFDFSGHATREALVDFAGRVNPRRILLVHGDEPALEWMAGALRTALPECDVIVPEPGARIRIDD